ncbi:MAG: epsJ [Frankiales bacterium]|nr:epsJ [Frankiales bacterium]
MTRPRVSVVVPAYNSEQTLVRTLEAVRQQTFPVHEIVVVDDGSADNTSRIGRAFGAQVVQQARSGPALARNAGVAESSGEWIAFCDSDDVWHAEKLERQAAYFATSDVVACDARIILGSRPIAPTFASSSPPATGRGLELLSKLVAANPIALSTSVVRRTSFLSVGGFVDAHRYAEDWSLWLRMALDDARFAHVVDALVDYTVQDSSVSSSLQAVAAAELRVLQDLAPELEAAVSRRTLQARRRRSTELWVGQSRTASDPWASRVQQLRRLVSVRARPRSLAGQAVHLVAPSVLPRRLAKAPDYRSHP